MGLETAGSALESGPESHLESNLESDLTSGSESGSVSGRQWPSSASSAMEWQKGSKLVGKVGVGASI